MSRLYDIIRQMEENSRAANISRQEIILLDSEKGNHKKWWRSYRVIILVGGITLVAVIGIAIGSLEISQLLKTQKQAIVASIKDSSPSALPGDSNVKLKPEPVALVNSKKSEEIEKPVEIKADVEESGKKQIEEVAEQKSQTSVRAKGPGENIPVTKMTHAKKASSSTRERQIPKKEVTAGKEPAAKIGPKERTSNSVKQEEKPVHVLPVQSGIITMAEEARKKGNIEEAIRLYKQYISLHRDPLVMNNLGALLISKGQLNEAEELLREAFQMTPDDDIAANLIGVEIMLGKLDKACDLFRQIKNIKPEIPSSLRVIESGLRTCKE